jgi:hypothetical protein
MNCVLISLTGARPWSASISFRQLKQLPLGCLGRGERAIFLEFHLPFFGRYMLGEDYISHDQSYHRDEERQRYS